MSVCDLYKTFITNRLSDILEYSEKPNEILIAKYAAELKDKDYTTSFVRSPNCKILLDIHR